MTTNNYFKNYNSFPQQQLLNDLSKEVIQMSGQDVLYLPRTVVKKDDLLGEDSMSKFESAVDIEMFITTPEGFGGGGDVTTKFGLDILDEINMVVNKERFFIETGMNAPREGDLIYLPLDGNIFEIKFVEDEKPFYTLGKNTLYEMTCEKFVFSEERFEVPSGQSGDIFDKFERENAASIKLKIDAGIDKLKEDEVVYQGDSLTTATAQGMVAGFNSSTQILTIYNVSGTFATNINIIGTAERDAQIERNVQTVNEQASDNTTYSDNDAYEVEGDNILDFSEIDPWSEGDL
jgi:hypothetical protein